MNRIHANEDIKPLSEFRSKMAYYFNKIKKTKRPLIITQNGKSTAIVLDVSEYEAMINKIELLEELRVSEEQIAKGLVISHDELMNKIKQKAAN